MALMISRTACRRAGGEREARVRDGGNSRCAPQVVAWRFTRRRACAAEERGCCAPSRRTAARAIAARLQAGGACTPQVSPQHTRVDGRASVQGSSGSGDCHAPNAARPAPRNPAARLPGKRPAPPLQPRRDAEPPPRAAARLAAARLPPPHRPAPAAAQQQPRRRRTRQATSPPAPCLQVAAPHLRAARHAAAPKAPATRPCRRAARLRTALRPPADAPQCPPASAAGWARPGRKGRNAAARRSEARREVKTSTLRV